MTQPVSNTVGPDVGTPVGTEDVNRRRSEKMKGNKNARKHGFYAARAALSEFGIAALDGRSTAAKLIAEIEEGFYADFGGRDACSTGQRILIRLCSKDVLFLNGLDCALLQQPSLIVKRKKSAIPLLQQRNQLAAGLAQRLGQLGLERRAAPIIETCPVCEAVCVEHAGHLLCPGCRRFPTLCVCVASERKANSATKDTSPRDSETQPEPTSQEIGTLSGDNTGERQT